MAASQAGRALRLRTRGTRDPRSLLFALADAQLHDLRPCPHPAEGHSTCCPAPFLAGDAHSCHCAVHARSGRQDPRGTRGSTPGAPCAWSAQRAPLRGDEEQRSTSARAPHDAQLRRQQLLRAWGKWRELHLLASRGLQCLPQGCLLTPGAPGGWSACRPLSGAATVSALPPDALPESEEQPWQQKTQEGRNSFGGNALGEAQEGPVGSEPELQGRGPPLGWHTLGRPDPRSAPKGKALDSQLLRGEESPRAHVDARAEEHGAVQEAALREREGASSMQPRAQRRLLVEERQELRRRQLLRKRRGQPGEGPRPQPAQDAGSWGLDSSFPGQGQRGGVDNEQMAAQGFPSGSKAASWSLDHTGTTTDAADPAQSQGSMLEPDSWWARPQAPWLLQEPLGVGALPTLPLPEDQRFLRVAIVGAPNAGKSSLVNCLVNARVSAVSRKTNTTTKEVLGISTEGKTQLVFHDTPGLLQEVSGRPFSQQARASAKAAMSVMERCQVLAMVVDAERQIRRPDPRVQRWAYRLGGAPTWSPESSSGAASATPSRETALDGQPLGEGSPGAPCPGPRTRILVLNKVDAIKDKKLLLPLAAHYGHLQGFQRTFMVSARKGKGVDHLKAFLQDMAVDEPWEEDPGRRTDQAVEELAMQMVRQALLNRLHQELPYRVQQQHVGTSTLRDGSVRLEQRLLVETLNQRGILLGSQGHNIRDIGTVARKHMEEALGCRVHLILDVKVARK